MIIDLVANHTSERHPWFQAARADRDSPFREWYVWRDERLPEEDGGEHHEVVFPGDEDSPWTYDEQAGQYYLHHFSRSQPDLHLTNPFVRPAGGCPRWWPGTRGACGSPTA